MRGAVMWKSALSCVDGTLLIKIVNVFQVSIISSFISGLILSPFPTTGDFPVCQTFFIEIDSI